MTGANSDAVETAQFCRWILGEINGSDPQLSAREILKSRLAEMKIEPRAEGAETSASLFSDSVDSKNWRNWRLNNNEIPGADTLDVFLPGFSHRAETGDPQDLAIIQEQVQDYYNSAVEHASLMNEVVIDLRYRVKERLNAQNLNAGIQTSIGRFTLKHEVDLAISDYYVLGVQDLELDSPSPAALTKAAAQSIYNINNTLDNIYDQLVTELDQLDGEAADLLEKLTTEQSGPGDTSRSVDAEFNLGVGMGSSPRSTLGMLTDPHGLNSDTSVTAL